MRSWMLGYELYAIYISDWTSPWKRRMEVAGFDDSYFDTEDIVGEGEEADVSSMFVYIDGY